MRPRWSEAAERPETDEDQRTARKRACVVGVFTQAVTFSEVRTSRVEAIRARIAAGTYFVPSELLAERLMHAMLVR